ncbi:uncharacterized, partial [Tachysurus ichikawai]
VNLMDVLDLLLVFLCITLLKAISHFDRNVILIFPEEERLECLFTQLGLKTKLLFFNYCRSPGEY